MQDPGADLPTGRAAAPAGRGRMLPVTKSQSVLAESGRTGPPRSAAPSLPLLQRCSATPAFKLPPVAPTPPPSAAPGCCCGARMPSWCARDGGARASCPVTRPDHYLPSAAAGAAVRSTRVQTCRRPGLLHPDAVLGPDRPGAARCPVTRPDRYPPRAATGAAVCSTRVWVGTWVGLLLGCARMLCSGRPGPAPLLAPLPRRPNAAASSAQLVFAGSSLPVPPGRGGRPPLFLAIPFKLLLSRVCSSTRTAPNLFPDDSWQFLFLFAATAAHMLLHAAAQAGVAATAASRRRLRLPPLSLRRHMPPYSHHMCSGAATRRCGRRRPSGAATRRCRRRRPSQETPVAATAAPRRRRSAASSCQG